MIACSEALGSQVASELSIWSRPFDLLQWDVPTSRCSRWTVNVKWANLLKGEYRAPHRFPRRIHTTLTSWFECLSSALWSEFPVSCSRLKKQQNHSDVARWDLSFSPFVDWGVFMWSVTGIWFVPSGVKCVDRLLISLIPLEADVWITGNIARDVSSHIMFPISLDRSSGLWRPDDAEVMETYISSWRLGGGGGAFQGEGGGAVRKQRSIKVLSIGFNREKDGCMLDLSIWGGQRRRWWMY